MMETDYAGILLGGGDQQAVGAQVADSGTDWGAMLLGPEVQREFSPTGSTSTITGKPILEWTPTGQKGAGFGTLMKQSFADDPQTKIKIFAEGRGISPDRYKVYQGEIVYHGDDGKWYPETQNTVGGSAKRIVAEGLADPSTAMSAFGAAGAGVPGAMLGAGGGAIVKQAIGKLVFDDQVDPVQTGIEAGVGAAGGAVGVPAGRVVNLAANKGLQIATTGAGKGNLGRIASQDIYRLNAPAMRGLAAKGAAKGVDLTTAETSNLGSLRTMYRTIKGLPGEAGDRLQAWEQTVRAPQMDTALERELGKISTQSSQFAAGRRAIDIASGEARRLKTARGAQANRLYNAAKVDETPVDVTPVVEWLDSKIGEAKESPTRASTLNRIRSLLVEKNKAKESPLLDATGNPIASGQPDKVPKQLPVKDLHQIKMELDTIIEGKRTAEGGLKGWSKADAVAAKEELLKVMEQVSPAYRAGRQAFHHYSNAVDKFSDSLLGSLVDKGDDYSFNAVNQLWKGSREEIRAAKAQISAVNPKAWDAVVRGAIQGEMEKLVDGNPASFGYRLRDRLFNAEWKRKKLQAAMTPEQFSSFSDLMDVFGATRRIIDTNSDTAFKQEGIRVLNEAAGGAAGWLAKALNLTPKGIAGTIQEGRRPEIALAIAQNLLRPDGMATIQRLKQLPPGSKATLQGLGSLFAVGGVGTVEKKLNRQGLMDSLNEPLVEP